LAAGDFNGDGYLDLAVANSGRGQWSVSILLGKGDGTFQAPVRYNVGGSPVSLVVGDFNGDGRLDLAAANRGPGSIATLLGNGDGTFQAPSLYGVPDPVGAPDALAIGDFNHDGIADLALANSRPAAIVVLLGAGGGAFQPPVEYPISSSSEWYVGGVAIADFNGDGTLDLAAISGGNIAILSGKGDGTFHAGGVFGLEAATYLTAGDFTGDGKPDVAVVAGAILSVLVNTAP